MVLGCLREAKDFVSTQVHQGHVNIVSEGATVAHQGHDLGVELVETDSAELVMLFVHVEQHLFETFFAFDGNRSSLRISKHSLSPVSFGQHKNFLFQLFSWNILDVVEAQLLDPRHAPAVKVEGRLTNGLILEQVMEESRDGRDLLENDSDVRDEGNAFFHEETFEPTGDTVGLLVARREHAVEMNHAIRPGLRHEQSLIEVEVESFQDLDLRGGERFFRRDREEEPLKPFRRRGSVDDGERHDDLSTAVRKKKTLLKASYLKTNRTPQRLLAG